MMACAMQRFYGVVRSKTCGFLRVCPRSYKLHPSGAFLETPTLASSLYLLLLRLLHRDYELVTRVMAACATDVPFSRDEEWIFSMFAAASDDRHPDAVATRLRLRLVSDESNSQWASELENPFPDEDIGKDYGMYISKFIHVSAAYRLNIDEEIALLHVVPQQFHPPNRAVYLRGLQSITEERVRAHSAAACVSIGCSPTSLWWWFSMSLSPDGLLLCVHVVVHVVCLSPLCLPQHQARLRQQQALTRRASIVGGNEESKGAPLSAISPSGDTAGTGGADTMDTSGDTLPPLPDMPPALVLSHSTSYVAQSRTLESQHPYRPGTDRYETIHFPGARRIVVHFVEASCTASEDDFVTFYKDSRHEDFVGARKYYGSQWPGVGVLPPLVIPSHTVIMHFRSTTGAPEWGWRAVFTADAPFAVAPLRRQVSSSSSTRSDAVAVHNNDGTTTTDGDDNLTTSDTTTTAAEEEDLAEAVELPVTGDGTVLPGDDTIAREIILESPQLINGGEAVGTLRKMMKAALTRVSGAWKHTVKYSRPTAEDRVHDKAHKMVQRTTHDEDLFLIKSFGLLYDILRGSVRLNVSCDDERRIDAYGNPLPPEPEADPSSGSGGDESKGDGGDESKGDGGDESKGDGGNTIDSDAAMAAALAMEMDARMAAQLAGVPYTPPSTGPGAAAAAGGSSTPTDPSKSVALDAKGPVHWSIGKLFAEMMLVHAQKQKKPEPLGSPVKWGYAFLLGLAHVVEQDAAQGLVTYGEMLGRAAQWPLLPYTGNEAVRGCCVCIVPVT